MLLECSAKFCLLVINFLCVCVLLVCQGDWQLSKNMPHSTGRVLTLTKDLKSYTRRMTNTCADQLLDLSVNAYYLVGLLLESVIDVVYWSISSHTFTRISLVSQRNFSCSQYCSAGQLLGDSPGDFPVWAVCYRSTESSTTCASKESVV